MSRSRGRSKGLVLTTEIFSVRTDIPSAMVLCALRGRLRRACLLRRQQGEPTLPPTVPAAPTPIVYLRFCHIQKADMTEAASLPVPTHQIERRRGCYGC